MNWLRRFLNDPGPREILLLKVEADQERAERLAERAEQVKARMGYLWCLHPDAMPSRERLDQLHAEALAEDQEREFRSVVRRFKRER